MFDWIKKHKAAFFISCLAILTLLVGIPFIINLLFKINSNICFLQAEWSAGDALGYYGAVLSFLGTVVLGALALYQNHIIKLDSDNKSALLEEKERLENMPKFYFHLRSESGYCGKLGLVIKNISNNIAYEIHIYDIRLKNGTETIWESSDTYGSPAINPAKQIEFQLSSPSVSEKDELILLANMSCKDKYDEKHEYILKMICRYPNHYGETSVTEI